MLIIFWLTVDIQIWMPKPSENSIKQKLHLNIWLSYTYMNNCPIKIWTNFSRGWKSQYPVLQSVNYAKLCIFPVLVLMKMSLSQSFISEFESAYVMGTRGKLGNLENAQEQRYDRSPSYWSSNLRGETIYYVDDINFFPLKNLNLFYIKLELSKLF